MNRERREFDAIPGTFVFDGQRTRQGYHLNMFCKSLDVDANRTRFANDPEGYLSGYPMTEDQSQAVMDRDFLKMLNLGGNIYYLWKIAAFDRISMQAAGAAQSADGMTEDQFRKMMLDGGRSIEGNRFPAPSDSPDLLQPSEVHARVVAGIGTSHVPAIGAALDNGKNGSPYWKPLFEQFDPAREWIAKEKPDVCIIVYNEDRKSVV